MGQRMIDYYVRRAQDRLDEKDVAILEDGAIMIDGKKAFAKVFNLREDTVKISAKTKKQWETFLNRSIEGNVITEKEIKQRLIELCPEKQGFGARCIQENDDKIQFQVCIPDNILPSLIPSRPILRQLRDFLDAMEIEATMACIMIKELNKEEK